MTYCNAGTDVAYINPFLYRGYYYDSESGLYYLMSRYYDPEIGQFISPDTQDYLDPETIGGVDLYAYCNNNPVMGYDPTGHWDWGTFWTGVGMIATAVTAIALVVTTLGAGTPLAISIVAGVTAAAGVLTGVNGIATVIEAGTDYNFVKDGVFQGNETAYNVYATITEGVAVVGSMILGGYQSTGRFKASKQGRELLGKGYKSVGKDRWVSKDGFRQMRMDKPHMYNGEKLNYHINLDTFKVNYWQNSRAPINKKIGLHLVYDFFSFIIK